MKIIYATKVWKGELKDVWGYHPDPDLVIGSNLGFDFVDMGDTSDPYHAPERRAIIEAKKRKATHILWYASDVRPPEGDWVTPALKLLKKYPIVSTFWGTEDFNYYASTAQRESGTGFELTDFGFEDHLFSDQAYLAKIDTMINIDYEIDHPIKRRYPPHGGNSFECRVAQWLATTGKKRAVLKDFRYRHTTKEEK